MHHATLHWTGTFSYLTRHAHAYVTVLTLIVIGFIIFNVMFPNVNLVTVHHQVHGPSLKVVQPPTYKNLFTNTYYQNGFITAGMGSFLVT